MSLEILQIKPLHEEYDNKKIENLNKNLIKPPFLGILNGSVRSGKSVVLVNMIYNKIFLCGYRGSR